MRKSIQFRQQPRRCLFTSKPTSTIQKLASIHKEISFQSFSHNEKIEITNISYDILNSISFTELPPKKEFAKWILQNEKVPNQQSSDHVIAIPIFFNTGADKIVLPPSSSNSSYSSSSDSDSNDYDESDD